MTKDVHPSERIWVKIDHHPSRSGGTRGAREKAMEMARDLAGSRVVLKPESSLQGANHAEYARALRSVGGNVKLCADLKQSATRETAEHHAAALLEWKPDMATTMCGNGVTALRRAREILDGARIPLFGVTLLSSMSYADCMQLYRCPPYIQIVRFAYAAAEAGLHGIVMPGYYIERLLREHPCLSSLEIVATSVRPMTTWGRIANDDQLNSVTPYHAMKSGATRIVIGRPLQNVPSAARRSRLQCIVALVKIGLAAQAAP